MQNTLEDSHFVPGIFYIQQFHSKAVETLCVWAEHIPLVLPKVDFVFIQKKTKKLFRTKEEQGLIKYDDLLSSLKEYFTVKENYMILNQNETTKISKAFNSLPLMGGLEHYGKGIPVEKIANVKEE